MTDRTPPEPGGDAVDAELSELSALYEHERARPDATPPRLERIRAAALARATAPEQPPADEPAAAVRGAGGRAAGRSLMAPVAMTSFVAGVVVGALGHGIAGSPPPSGVAPDAPFRDAAPVPAVTLDGGPGDVVAPPAGPLAEPAVEATSAAELAVTLPPDPPGGLAAERRLIEAAQSAIAGGRWDAALRALESHSRRFPMGRLAEERDALRVEALAASGRDAEARMAAEEFLAGYPQSIHAAAVARSLGGRPADPLRSEDPP